MIRRFKRRFSVSAPRLAVRPHLPWYVRWAIILPTLLVIGLLIWWAYDAGMELAGFRSGEAEQLITELRERVKSLEDENGKQAKQIAESDRQVQMQQAMANEVQLQVKALHDENEQLKEDLSFFQNLPLAGGSDAELSIRNLKLVGGSTPGEYHCRMLLVQGVQRRGKEFQGELKILVSANQGGQKVVIQLPQNTAEMAGYKLNFKYYQSLDKVFKLPAEVQVESVEIKVFEKGMQEPKVKQTVLL